MLRGADVLRKFPKRHGLGGREIFPHLLAGEVGRQLSGGLIVRPSPELYPRTSANCQARGCSTADPASSLSVNAPDRSNLKIVAPVSDTPWSRVARALMIALPSLLLCPIQNAPVLVASVVGLTR